MKERLLNNLGLKILSIFLAFLVWLVVVNVSNPEISASREVPIEVLNENVMSAAKMTYEIVGKETVTVSYRVRTLDAPYVTAADFHAYIDLADLYDVTGSVPVKIEVSANKESLIESPAAKPGVIHVKTEKLQRKKFDLKVNKSGTLEDGYALGTTTLSPESVYVTGPVSQVGKISEVGIEVNVDNANADLSGTTSPVFYDANGNSLDDMMDKVTLSTQEISYSITMLKVKNLTLDFDVQGEVAAGYRFTGVECETKSIPVVGMRSVLASLSTLTIPASELDISGATKDRVVTVDVSKYLPPSASIAGDADSSVKVVMRVERLESREFTLDMNEVAVTGESEDYLYSYDPDHVLVTVRGLKEDLDTLTKEDLHASMDVSEFSPAVHKGELTFEIGEGFEVMSYSDFNVTVGAVQAPSEEAESSDGTGESGLATGESPQDGSSQTVNGTVESTSGQSEES